MAVGFPQSMEKIISNQFQWKKRKNIKIPYYQTLSVNLPNKSSNKPKIEKIYNFIAILIFFI